MPTLTKKVERASHWMLREELFGAETILAICALWAAHTLLSGPSNFIRHHADYALLVEIMRNESRWGFLAAAACLFHVLGLGFLTLETAPTLSVSSRCLGLFLSGFLWSVIGWSFLLGNPDSLTAVPLIMIGLTALWTLMRFPFVPKQPQ